MSKLTAFLIVRNEELRLPRCLQSLQGSVDRIVVVDTGSQDRTGAILDAAAARAAPPLRWRAAPFAGFGQSRQVALDLVESEWALWIDADEWLSAPLADRLRQLRTTGELDRHDAWRIRLENRVCGRVMRGRNLARQAPLRLFRARQARITDRPVHEGVILPATARIGRLEEPLIHDTVVSWRRYLRKIDHYTDLEAAEPGRPFLPLHLLVTGPATLWREYVWRQGWRDGWPGLLWAGTTAWGSLLRDWKRLRRRYAGSR
jgi:(heptosyl)LPS beta-1,4-glucosyltransferase